MASSFADLMLEAQQVTVALDALTNKDGPKATAAAVSDGVLMYSLLLRYRETYRMTISEMDLLQQVSCPLGLVRVSESARG